ncbi:MAG: GNAT family N-acetyltransferase [Sphaerochaetaceae bacterium]|nr:GNAT family N-acetyltransferase [Sphaerochaetaceae bacterium]
MEICIVEAKKNDAKNLLIFFKQIGSETNNLTFGKEGFGDDVEKEEKILEKYRLSQSCLLLAKNSDNKIIASSSLVISDKPRLSKKGEIGVSVLKEFWNLGIGSALLKKLICIGKEKKLYKLDLKVAQDNFSAIHLYEKLGFMKKGEEDGMLYVEGKQIKGYFYELIL